MCFVSGFWQRLDSFSEQPDVKFKYQLLVIIDTSTSGDYVTWSTYQNFNQLQMDRLRVPLLKVVSYTYKSKVELYQNLGIRDTQGTVRNCPEI